MEASASIGAFVRKHSGALQARYAGQVFAVLLPNMSESEMVDGASQLLKSLQRATLHEVEGGDHSFKVSGRGAKPDDVLAGIMDVVAGWIRQLK